MESNIEQPRALVVEDNELDRLWLVQALESAGVKVIQADTAKKAMAILEKQNIRMVLVNLKLPDMDGCDLIRYIRDHLGHIPTAVVSGYDDEESRERCFTCGAVTFFPKPWSQANTLNLLSLFDLTTALYQFRQRTLDNGSRFEGG